MILYKRWFNWWILTYLGIYCGFIDYKFKKFYWDIGNKKYNIISDKEIYKSDIWNKYGGSERRTDKYFMNE